jgi:hypothetical protein
MYNPFPHLPEKFQKILISLREKKVHTKIVFFVMGFLATIWFLIRVIPKPSRANYPCMQATAPFMSGFVVYLLSLGGSIASFKFLKINLVKARYFYAFAFLVSTISLYLFSQTQFQSSIFANKLKNTNNYFTPNEPIGDAKGIFPGRVVWMWDADATNINCTNTSNNNGIIDDGDDAWFMEINNDAAVIDSMIIKSLFALTGESVVENAWNKIFKYYNNNHGFGDIGYNEGEKILIKINATSAYGSLETGKYYADLSRNDDLSINPFTAETNPYLVLSVLHHLVENAGVAEEMIYLGDPARNIYKEFYDLWHNDFPNVNYLGNNLIHPELEIENLGRLPVEISQEDKIVFSDHGTVMPDAISDKLFTIFDSIDYLINIPTMKAHASAGITLNAKNHFGSFPRTWAMHLHPGLIANNDEPIRLGYGLYRIQTDIMMHNLLSGKNLFLIVDGLFPGEDAGAVPEKWTSIPFNNDWASSIFMSLDPVAIESVCHDFLRTEYNGPTIAESRPNWHGVDDYLHQAADSSLWPENIVYDPNNNGILIASLGVHEHWNDSLNKKYTRNLGTGDGIELIKVHNITTGINDILKPLYISAFPNPTTNSIFISNNTEKSANYSLSDLNGKTLLEGKIEGMSKDQLNLENFSKGTYFINFIQEQKRQNIKIIKQ